MIVPKQIIKAYRFRELYMYHGGHREHGEFKSINIIFSVISVFSVVDYLRG